LLKKNFVLKKKVIFGFCSGQKLLENKNSGIKNFL